MANPPTQLVHFELSLGASRKMRFAFKQNYLFSGVVKMYVAFYVLQ